MKELIELIEQKRLEMQQLMRELTEKHNVIRVSVDGFEEDEHLSILLDEEVFLNLFSDFDVRKHKEGMHFPYELIHRDGGIHYCTLLDERAFYKHVQRGKKLIGDMENEVYKNRHKRRMARTKT